MQITGEKLHEKKLKGTVKGEEMEIGKEDRENCVTILEGTEQA